MKRLLIIGAGQYGMAVKELAEEIGGYDEICFLDDNSELAIGKTSDIENVEYDEAVIAIGNSKVRSELFKKIKKSAILVHQSASVAKSAKIGEGSVIEAGAVISSNASVGKGCIVMANAVVGHNAIVGDFCQLKYNSVVADNCVVSEKQRVEFCTACFGNLK